MATIKKDNIKGQVGSDIFTTYLSSVVVFKLHPCQVYVETAVIPDNYLKMCQTGGSSRWGQD